MSQKKQKWLNRINTKTKYLLDTFEFEQVPLVNLRVDNPQRSAGQVSNIASVPELPFLR